MSKFKENDKVRVINYDRSTDGSLGVVVALYSSGSLRTHVRMTEPRGKFVYGNTYGFRDDELELVGNPNSLVGKNIRVTRVFDPKPNMVWTGTVKSQDENGITISMYEDGSGRTLYFNAGRNNESTDSFEVIPDPLPTRKNAIIEQGGSTFIKSDRERWRSVRSGQIYSDKDLFNTGFRVIFEGQGEWC